MIRLETGTTHLQRYFDSVIALVTDQGTEHLISDAGPVNDDILQQDDLEALKPSTGGNPAPVASLEDDSFHLGQPSVRAATVIDLLSDADDAEDDDATKHVASSSSVPARPVPDEILQLNDPVPDRPKSIPKMHFGNTIVLN